MFDHLLDHVADIPKISAAYAEIEEQLCLGQLSQDQAETRRTEVFTYIGNLVCRMRHWKKQWADAYPGGRPYEVPVVSPGELFQQREQGQQFSGHRSFHLPPFPCRAHLHKHGETKIYYPDITLAYALHNYYTMMLVFKGFGVPNCPIISDSEAYDLVCLICRSAEYHLLFTLRGALTIKPLLFTLRGILKIKPFQLASELLPGGSPERAWLDNLLQIIENGQHMVS